MNSWRPGVSNWTPSKTISQSDRALNRLLTSCTIVFESRSASSSPASTSPLQISLLEMRKKPYSSSARDLARTQYTPPG